MVFKSVILVLACGLVASDAQKSMDALPERVKNFRGFYASKVEEIMNSDAETKTAVNSITTEVQKLFKMVVTELISMDEKNDVLQNENGNLRKTNAEQLETIEEKNNESKVLKQEVNHLRTSQEDMTEAIKSLNATLITVTTEKSVLEKNLQQMEEECKGEVEEASKIHEKNQILQNEKENLRKENAKQLEIIKAKNSEIEKKQSQNSNLNKINKEMTNVLAKAKEENNKCKDDKKTLNEAINDLETLKEDMTGIIESLNATITIVTTERSTLEEELLQMKQKLQEKIRKLQNEVHYLTAQNTEYLETISSKKAIIQEMQKQIKKLEQESGTEISEKLEAAQKTILELEMENKRIKIKLQISRGDYRVVNGRYVKFYDTKVSWKKAFETCKNASSQLITAKDRATRVWLKYRYKPVWIGATDEGHEGKWTWVDGTLVADGYWSRGEPNNGRGRGSENCAAANYYNHYYHSHRSSAKWSDHSCNLSLRFACEIPGYPVEEKKPQPDKDSDEDEDFSQKWWTEEKAE